MIFKDRQDAGNLLSLKLIKFKNSKNTLLLALPRGGVIIASPISKSLALPLDIIIPRKIGAPSNEELAIGAICQEEIVLNQNLIEALHVHENYLKKTIDEEKREAIRRNNIYRKNKMLPQIENKIIILIDDGIATGSTMEVAVKYVRTKKPKQVVIAIPILPSSQVKFFKQISDELIYLDAPENFSAIGNFYEDFDQVSDQEVLAALQESPSS